MRWSAHFSQGHFSPGRTYHIPENTWFLTLAHPITLFNSVKFWSSGSYNLLTFERNPMSCSNMPVKVGKICFKSSHPLFSLPLSTHYLPVGNHHTKAHPTSEFFFLCLVQAHPDFVLFFVALPGGWLIWELAIKGQWRNVTSLQIQHNIRLMSCPGLTPNKIANVWLHPRWASTPTNPYPFPGTLGI